MTRRKLLSTLAAAVGAGTLGRWRGAQAAGRGLGTLELPAEYWRDKVAPAAWAVLFEEDTEPAFSSPLNAEKRSGTYVCAACHLPLFSSTTKFDSGTGWPSFWASLPEAIGTRRDFKLIVPRIEYHCRRCGGHQGHVFDDGPPPTGLRYCNNGLALRFAPAGEPLPALRP
ncbi:peptide-methionine (R)-S-oxide reductase MsrB [Sinimarinibacterium thermocellulolyticum]|uniref:peptide-methionine (R)-S-oxide reductase n=1 Tax=Sinimarinibacterium thermocellulolyticum TaxID=3170016 RepID=A0ABV2ACC0_9GAMM